MKTYKRSVELNDPLSPSTGAATFYAGKSPWPKAIKKYMFMELSDCQGKVRLHISQIDTEKAFIRKMKRLHKELGKFIEHLEAK